MKNPPIAYNPMLHAVMLASGTLVPAERYRERGEKVWLAQPRSAKEARRYAKTVRMAKRRFKKDPIGYLDAYLQKKRS